MNWTRRQDVNQTLTAFSRTSWIRRWMEVAGRIWASYWLLICGSFLIVGSVVLTWLEFPYSFNVGGFELPVQNVVPHFHEFSYGLSGIAVLAVAFCFRKRFRWSLLLGAAILLTLWIFVPARITAHQPTLLRRLSEEGQAVPVIKAFTRRAYLPRITIRPRRSQNISTWLLSQADLLRRSLSSGRVGIVLALAHF